MLRIFVFLALSLGLQALAAPTIDSRALFKPLSAEKAKRGPAQYVEDSCGPADELPQPPRFGKLKNKKGVEFQVSVVTLCQAAKLFAEVSKQPQIPFRYPEDGCYARAHAMSRLMEKEGVISGKVFIEGNLRVETPYAPGGYVEWWYHVAPIVIVERGGIQDVAVFDPSIFDRAVTVEEWFQIQTKHEGGRRDQTYQTQRYAYTPYNQDDDLNEYRAEDLSDMESTMARYLEVQNERDLERARHAGALAAGADASSVHEARGRRGHRGAVENKPAADTVVVINDSVRDFETDETETRVHFKRHAAVYRVKKGSAKENEILQALVSSEATGKKVRVKVGSRSLEIKELAPAKPKK